VVNTSNTYKEKIYTSGRKFHAKARIELSDQTILELKDEDIMQNGITIEDCVSPSNSFEVGSAIINELTLELYNLDEKFNSTRLGIGEHTDILETYRMFAKDKGWYKKISDNIESGLTAEAAATAAKEQGVVKVDVYVKGLGAGRENAIRSLQTAGLEITSITDETPVPHNGCRPPKRPRN